MKQNLEASNILVAAFRPSIAIIFQFSTEAMCQVDNSHKKGGSKWRK